MVQIVSLLFDISNSVVAPNLIALGSRGCTACQQKKFRTIISNILSRKSDTDIKTPHTSALGFTISEQKVIFLCAPVIQE